MRGYARVLGVSILRLSTILWLAFGRRVWRYQRGNQGRIQGGGGGGGAPDARPLKLEKIWFFFAWNCDFSHEIPQKFSRLPPQLEKIWLFGVKSWFFTRNTPTIFAPPPARRIFFKCAPPNLKSWIRPW